MPVQRIAAIYARVSDLERTQGIIPSTDTQVMECKRKAAALGLAVAAAGSGLIVEEQHSGEDLRWLGTQFMELVRRAQQHEFTDLICLNIDRFSRGGAAAFQEQEGYFKDAGVTVHYVQFELPPGTPMASGVKGLIADAAQYWKDGIKEASVRVRTNYAKEGNIIPGNVPPFGFQFVTDPARRTKRNLPVVVGLVPDPETGPALLHMTEWVANGGSVGALPDWLAAQGIRTVRGDSLVWRRSTILDILHNHTNYGGRRSHRVHAVPRPQGHRRAISVKTRNQHERVPLDKQHRVADGRVTPPEGLTYDLWRRAVDRLEENKQVSARHATAPEGIRAERGLLFGGLVRCAICGGGLRLKPTSKVKHTANGARWEYVCYHTGTSAAKESPVSMTTTRLDGAVWRIAVDAIRDETFLTQLIAETDESAAGPTVQAASLRTRTAEADREHAILMKHLGKYDPDDPDNAGMIDDIERKLKANRALRADLNDSLTAAEAAIQNVEARRASIRTFRAYAARQRAGLDDKTALERRNILRALRTRCRLGPGATLSRLAIHFDIRHLPDAITALHDTYATFDHENDSGNLRDAAPDSTPLDFRNVPDLTFIEDDEEIQPDAKRGIVGTGGGGGAVLENELY